MIVIDASALTGFLLTRPSALDVAVALAGEPDPDPFHAPDLIEPETLNALRRLARRGTVSAERATHAVGVLGAFPLIRYPHSPLRGRVWDLRDELSAYDAMYLALAEGLDGSVLLTADRELAARARRSLGAEGVRLVE